ncbi:MAG TPA: extracellular solute-binding protein [Chthonomonadaceae bacterium]|nr:extracellular solute-binding protein [Chthonomonadaceae bacterium]
MRKVRWIGRGLAICGVLALLAGCGSSDPGLTLYSDQPQAVVEPLVKQFETEQHVPVHVVYASAGEVARGKGLSERVRAEAGAPQADLYWACGPAAIEKLRQDGLLEKRQNFSTAQIAAPFRSPDSLWHGIGTQVRVLLYNTRLVRPDRAPRSIASLAQPAWKGRGAMADPRANGSANYHILYLFATLPPNEASALLTAMKANAVQFLPDEAAVVEAVSSGKAAWGVTDSDLAITAVKAGKPVRFQVTDQEPFATAEALGKVKESVPTIGTPLLPAPLAILKGTTHLEKAWQFVDFMTSPQTAARLAELLPARLPTHTELLNGLQDEQINPLKLKTLPVTASDIMDAAPKAATVLDQVLGAAH